MRNGFRETSNQQDIEGIDRIEVLKGPVSVFYGGALASGGVVNIVTKSPESTNFTHVGLTGGSFARVRPTFDINRGLTDDRSLELRIDGAYDQSDSFRKFSDSRSTFINPSLRWKPSDQDEVLLRFQYYHSDFSYGEYQSPLTERTLSLPLSFSFNDPNQNQSRKDAERLSYEWTHLFDSGLKFRSGFNISTVKYKFGTDRLARLTLLSDDHAIKRVAQSGPQRITDYDWQNEVSGTFDTKSLRHQWLAGVEAYWSDNNATGNQVILPNLDILNPVYGVSIAAPKLTRKTSSSFYDYAGYVQDFITISPHWSLLIGGRYDTTRTKSLNRLTDVKNSDHTGKFSPAVGVTYKPVATTAFYFNWTNSFVPTTATTVDGSALPPSSSEQYEIGVKQQSPDKRLQATLAFYQLTKTNIPTQDLNNPLFRVASGKQRSRGVELDVSGEILPGWNTIASYTYTFARVIKDNRLPVGNLVAGVPRHAASFWTTYTFLNGLGIGGGMRIESHREATLPNTFRLPGYARFDVASWYRFDVNNQPFKIQVNFLNITNRRIYNTDGSRTLRAQLPFTILAGISTEF
ncbi:TonB-dependent receptor [Nitrosomonas sp. HPC101]|uniref:TonB-dependent siderophore receptor n=1 Tax=Nitrosomonas sp. HPC101 TaxID=1658667 RepID=UPI00136D8FB2|nr:TonB-dependent receptor [Nitrosomonas sp. HPC101]